MNDVLPKPANAKAQMPQVTSFFAGLRDAFGDKAVDAWIVSGKADGTFWAVENGYAVGTPPREVVEEHRRRLAEARGQEAA